MKTFARYFVQGLFVTVPIALTLYVIWAVISTIDGLLPIGVPGLGFVLTIAFVSGIGFLASNVLGRTLLELTERVLKRVPLVKLLYTSIQDLLEAFVGKRRSFDKPVAVELPGDLRVLGFVTCESLRVPSFEPYVAVYFPQSYNFAGNLVLVPRSRVLPLSVVSSDLMTFIVSGGVSSSTLRDGAEA